MLERAVAVTGEIGLGSDRRRLRLGVQPSLQLAEDDPEEQVSPRRLGQGTPVAGERRELVTSRMDAVGVTVGVAVGVAFFFALDHAAGVVRAIVNATPAATTTALLNQAFPVIFNPLFARLLEANSIRFMRWGNLREFR